MKDKPIRGHDAVHVYVKRRLPEPDKCPSCSRAVKLDLCNISPIFNNQDTYNRDLQNWYYACRRCHMYRDGRINKLINDILKPFPKGHQFGFKKDNTVWVGRKHSEESRKKMSEARKKMKLVRDSMGRFTR